MSNELAVQSEPQFVKASTALSQQLGLEPQAMVDALKSQFFKGKDATNAQLAIVVSIARELKLNPLLPGQLYPYPDRSGSVVVMLGPDGIMTLLANNPDIVMQKDGGPAYWTEHGKDADGKEICTGFINHRQKGLLKKTIWVDEWTVSSNPNWSTRKHHMAEIRALKQAARMVIHGIPADSDEHKLGEMLNVTETTEEAPAAVVERPLPKPRATRGAAAAKAAEVVVEQEPVKPEEKPASEAAPQDNAKLEADLKAREAKLAAIPTGESPEAKAAAETEKSKLASEAGVAAATRASLNDGEEATFLCAVKSLKALEGEVDGKKAPSVLAEVTGGFNSSVRHFGGASPDGKGGFTPNAPWAVGAELRLTLKGQKSKAAKTKADGSPNPSFGKIIPWVSAITSAEAAHGATEFGE